MKTNSSLFISTVTLVLLAGCVEPDPYVRRRPPPPPPAVVYYQAPAPQEEIVVAGEPPPPPAPQVQLVITRPGPGYIWIDGYWSWQARSHSYVWTVGRWENPPRRGAQWVGAHWERRSGGSVFIEGTWR